MQVSKAINMWLEYHKSHSRGNTLKAYQVVLSNFDRDFGQKEVREITSDEVLSFLNRITEGKKQQTKRTRYAHLSAINGVRFSGSNTIATENLIANQPRASKRLMQSGALKSEKEK